jgi:hypothetical protein
MKKILPVFIAMAFMATSCTKDCQDCVIRESDGQGNITETPIKVCKGDPAPAAADCTP